MGRGSTADRRENGEPGRALSARLLFQQAMAWIGVVLFGSCTVYSLVAGLYGPAFGFLAVAFGCLGIAGLFGRLTLDARGVRHECVYGRFEMGWDEIDRIEHEGLKNTLSLRSAGGKRLPIPGPTSWMGPDGDAMRALWQRKIDELGIRFKLNPFAVYHLPRKVRVRAGDGKSGDT